MKNLRKIMAVPGCLLAMVACERPELSVESLEDGQVKICVMAQAGTKTQLGEWNGDSYDVVWSAGDMISVNGVPSEPLEVEQEGVSGASFTLYGVSAPYDVVYPSSVVKSCSGGLAQVLLPSVQKYVEGSFADGSALLYGRSDGEDVILHNACGVLKIGLRQSLGASVVSAMKVSSEDVPLSGNFSLDFEDGEFIPGGDNGNDVVLQLPQTGVHLSDDIEYFYVSVPAGQYDKGFILTVTDDVNAEGTEIGKTAPENKVPAGMLIKVEAGFTPESLEIHDVESWNSFAEAVMAGDYGAWLNAEGEVCVTEDFTVPADNPLVRISRGETDGFDGILNGQGHTITFEDIREPLFIQTASSGVIKNLTIAGGRTSCHDWGTCNFVVYNHGLIENCESKVEVNIPQRTGELLLSGFVRNNAGVMRKCTNSGRSAVEMRPSSAVRLTAGGLACSSSHEFEGEKPVGEYHDCHNTADIYVHVKYAQKTYLTYIDMGGIVARVDGGTAEDYVVIEDCTNSGDITLWEETTAEGKTNYGCSYSVGGIVGSVGMYNSSLNSGWFLSPTSGGYLCDIARCSNSGDVSLCAYNKAVWKTDPTVRGHAAAGVVSHIYGPVSGGMATITSCTNTGDVDCGYSNVIESGEQRCFSLAAGILGVGMNVTVSDCSSTAAFGLPEGALWKGFTGGIAGYFVRNSVLKDCSAVIEASPEDEVKPFFEGYVGGGVLKDNTLTLSGTNTLNGNKVTSGDMGTMGTGNVVIEN